MTTLTEALDMLADGDNTPANIAKGIEAALELGYSVHELGDLKAGSSVAYVYTDPFGFGPEPDAVLHFANVTKVTAGTYGDINIHHSGGVTSGYSFEYCLSKLS